MSDPATMQTSTESCSTDATAKAAGHSCDSHGHAGHSHPALPLAGTCAAGTPGDVCGAAPVDESSLPAPPTEVQILDSLKQVIDPELMINIVDLGLIYAVEQTDRKAAIEMTLTSPACPAGPQLIQQTRMVLEKFPGITNVEVRLVMSPPWTPERMTDEARDQLGIF